MIVFNWSGHGHFDLAGYERYFTGKLEDYAMSDEELQRTIACLDLHPKPRIKTN